RWAKPVRPGFSLAGPTWYHRFTATSGRRWSSLRMTSSPFLSLYFSNLMVGALWVVAGAALVACDTAGKLVVIASSSASMSKSVFRVAFMVIETSFNSFWAGRELRAYRE